MEQHAWWCQFLKIPKCLLPRTSTKLYIVTIETILVITPSFVVYAKILPPFNVFTILLPHYHPKIDKICTALCLYRHIVCPSVSPLCLPLTES
jgi:hypothetical protein